MKHSAAVFVRSRWRQRDNIVVLKSELAGVV
jgi:hypothetical protein